MARLSVGIKDIASSLCLLTMLFGSTALGADGPHDGSSPAKASAPSSSQAMPPAPLSAPSSQATQTRVVEGYGNLPLSFEVNQGQTDSEVRFLSRGKGYTLFLTPAEAVLALLNPSRSDPGSSRAAPGRMGVDSGQNTTVLRMKLLGANPGARITGGDELQGKSNYFIGNDPKKWHTDVSTYQKVSYGEIYPGIDLIYYGNQRQLEYDFVVSPGADPSSIRLKIDGARKLRVGAEGDLVLRTSGGEVRMKVPHVYQEVDGKKQEVQGRWERKGKQEVGIQLAAYDRSKTLVVDPVLIYSTYLGGSSSDFGLGLSVDTAGNAYVTGQTASTDFPTAGAIQSKCGGCGTTGTTDAFVTKFNAAGSALVYSTYLGGGSDVQNPGAVPRSQAFGIAVSAIGNAFVVGFTTAHGSFPTSPTQTGCAAVITSTSCSNAFLVEMSTAGNSLVYGQFIQGDHGNAVAIDPSGNAYVTGNAFGGVTLTSSLQPTFGGGTSLGDAFVAKVNPVGTIAWWTYLGGSGEDVGNGIALDPNGNVYVTGSTTNVNVTIGPNTFPIKNAVQSTYGGSTDAFVAMINNSGTALVYSTFLGGSSTEGGAGIAVDTQANAYVTGFTQSADFPTVNAFQGQSGGGPSDTFVAKINPGGSALVYSTYLGGSGGDVGKSIRVDSVGNTYVAGYTSSTNFPTLNPIQSSLLGSENAFVTELNPVGNTLVFSTYLGGSTSDQAFALALDTVNSIYLIGGTTSTDFPTAAGPFLTCNIASGACADAFLTKISSTIPVCGIVLTEVGFTITANVQCTGDFVAPADPNHPNQQIIVRWNDPNGSISGTGSGGGSNCGVNGNTCAFSPSNTYPAGAGTSFQIQVDATDASGQVTTIFQTINVGPIVVTVSPNPVSVLANATQQFTANVTNATDKTVTWLVGGVKGGNSVVGTISNNPPGPPPPGGLFSAPTTVPSGTTPPGTVIVTAISNADGTTPGTATAQIQDFGLSLSPSSANVAPGQAASATVTVTSVNGFAGTVSLSCTGLPSGSACSFCTPPGSTCTFTPGTAPVTVPANGTVTLTFDISTSAATPAGNYSISLTGTAFSSAGVSSGVSRSQTFSLGVVSAGSCGLTLNPTSQSIVATGGTGTIAVTTLCNWTATSNFPNFITVTSGSSGAGNGTIAYSVAANSTTSQRTGTITVVGAGSSLSFTVNQAGQVAVTVSPSTVSVQTGATAQFAASVINTTNTAVTWSVSGSGCQGRPCGTIAQTGLYAAPKPGTLVSGSQIDTVTATSQAASSAAGSAQVTVFEPPSVPQPPQPQTVTAGQPASYTISVAANTGDTKHATTLACKPNSLPNGVTCSFTPPQVTFGSAGASFQVILNTTGQSALLTPRPEGAHGLFAYASLLPLAGVVFLGIGKKRRRLIFSATALVLCACLLFVSACSTNGTFGTPPNASLSATPTGQFTIVIIGQTASQQTQGLFTVITNVSLTVH